MQYRPFGATSLKVSAVGFGAWGIGGNAHGNSYGPTDDAESVRAVRRALDLGCTFFDTADVYGWGHSEEVLGRALEGRREDVVVATKVGGDFYHGGVRLNFSPDYVRFALDQSLKRLRTPWVDVYQLHNPPAELLGDPATYKVLEALKGEGLVRHYGVSIHDPTEGLVAMEAAPIASIQVVYNLLRREPEEALLPAAAKRRVAVIAREPLHNGFLTGKFRGDEGFAPGDIRSHWPASYRKRIVEAAHEVLPTSEPGPTPAQAAIAFCLENPAIATTIPGCKTVAQVDENLGTVAIAKT